MERKFCPYCGGQMEIGKLYSRGSNYYLPDGQKLPAWYSARALKKRNAIPLPPDPLGIQKPADVEWPVTFACRNCKFLLIPYEE